MLFMKFTIIDKFFTTNVTLLIKLPTTEIESLKAILISLTNNQITIEEKAI